MKSIKLLLITSNVGSLFTNDPRQIQTNWLESLKKILCTRQPSFLALHLQEVGGKDYSKYINQIDVFIQKLYDMLTEQNYRNGRAFIDDEFEATSYTALGNLYMVHKDFKDVGLFNFLSNSYMPVTEFLIYKQKSLAIIGNVKKERFVNACASRKGFMWTRWKLAGKIMNFTNVHLFHDACNITSIEQSPSVYSNKRKDALLHVLASLDKVDSNADSPLFVFGDFNFRLNLVRLLKDLTENTEKSTQESLTSNGEINCIEFKSKTGGEIVLRLGTKTFECKQDLNGLKYQAYDWESTQFEMLREAAINFPPSYPYSEDLNQPNDFMRTRPPAYCDRIFLNDSAWNLAKSHNGNQKMLYETIGKDVCIGDHKPVCLFLHVNS